LSKSNSRTFQGPYEGHIRRTTLNQTGTFISVYKRCKLTQRGPGQSLGRKWKKEAIWYTFSFNWFGHGVLENQIQGFSRTMSVFKDFPGVENLEKKFKDFQRPARALITACYASIACSSI